MSESNDNVNHCDRAVDHDVLDLVHTVMHQLRAQQFRVLRDGPHDITQMDSRVLGYFGRHPGATQSDLAAFSGRDKAQLARLVAGLRERGLLAGTPDPADRRSVRLTLTDEGRALQRTLHLQGRRLNAKAVASLDAAEQRQLIALLEKVKQALDRPDGDGAGNGHACR